MRTSPVTATLAQLSRRMPMRQFSTLLLTSKVSSISSEPRSGPWVELVASSISTSSSVWQESFSTYPRSRLEADSMLAELRTQISTELPSTPTTSNTSSRSSPLLMFTSPVMSTLATPSRTMRTGEFSTVVPTSRVSSMSSPHSMVRSPLVLTTDAVALTLMSTVVPSTAPTSNTSSASSPSTIRMSPPAFTLAALETRMYTALSETSSSTSNTSSSSSEPRSDVVVLRSRIQSSYSWLPRIIPPPRITLATLSRTIWTLAPLTSPTSKVSSTSSPSLMCKKEAPSMTPTLWAKMCAKPPENFASTSKISSCSSPQPMYTSLAVSLTLLVSVTVILTLLDSTSATSKISSTSSDSVMNTSREASTLPTLDRVRVTMEFLTSDSTSKVSSMSSPPRSLPDTSTLPTKSGLQPSRSRLPMIRSRVSSTLATLLNAMVTKESITLATSNTSSTSSPA
mmetsp:Transcript_24747/g.69303  ORF Transcript_24747/g.69303 Transcript_24747/m.69303 type:complete len:454 (+) Transcript_24747:1951-3312(+)